MQNEPTIVTNWDSMPPEVYAEGEIYSTRVLAAKYQKMEKALKDFKEQYPNSPWIHKQVDDALKI
ncbi:hypothetical protein J7L48_02875 [bacterium]|nr:hypothetical protein [bacterium]